MNETMSNTIRIIAIILFLVALGVGGWFLYDRVIRPSTDPTTQGPTTEITVWGLWETEADFQVLADAYTSENSNVTITYVERDATDYHGTTLGRISTTGSQAPDIIMVHNTWRSEFEDFLAPLPTAVMTEQEYNNTFYDTALSDFKGANNGIYAIPLMFDSLGLYYNTDLLEAEGYTSGPEDNWDELIQQARQLTKYDENGRIEVAGLAMGTSTNVEFSSDIVNLLILQQGAEPVNSNGMSGLADDTLAEEALEFYTDFSIEDELWNDTLDRDITMFAEGRLAMMFAPSWRVHDIASAQNEFLNFDIAPVPQLSNFEGQDVNWSNYWAFGVTGTSTRQAEAWEFLEWASQPDQLRMYYTHVTDRDEARLFGEIYSRRDMASELQDQQYVSAYITMAQNGAQTWDMKKSIEIQQAIDTEIDKIVKDQADPDEAIEQIVTVYNGLASNTSQ